VDSAGGVAEDTEPSARVEIWVGGRSRAAQRLAAEFGGWLPAFATAQQISEELASIEQTFAPVKPARVGTILPIGPMGDRGAAQRWMARLFDLEAYPSRLVLPGGEEQLRLAVSEYVSAGVNHICLLVADDRPGPTLAWAAETLGVASQRVPS
jgi:hypothetical protein